MKGTRIVVASALALQLSACGGGSGGGVNSTPAPTPAPAPTPTPSPSPTPAPTPAPTPTPTPAPTPTPTPTPATVLPPISNQSTSVSFPIVAGDSKRLSYDASAKTYTVAADYTGAPYAPVTFSAADIVAGEDNFTTYQHPDASGGGKVDRLALSKPGTDNSKIPLTYSGYGSYSVGLPSGLAPEYFVFGRTPTATPLTGVATYSGIVDGCDVLCGNKIGGTSTLSLNLQSAALTTQLALSFTRTSNNFTQLAPISLSGVGYLDIANGSSLTGSLTNADGSVQGWLLGGLYGPNDEEFGFRFSTTATSSNYNLNGAAIGSLQGISPNPADQTLNGSLQRGDAFDAADASIALDSATSGNISWSGSGQVLLRYDAATDSYILTRGFGKVLTFGAPNRQADVGNFATYAIVDPTDPANAAKNQSIALFKIGGSNSTIDLTYTSYGSYALSTTGNVAPTNGSFFVYGVATPVSAIPTTGTASFSGIVDGTYVDPNGAYRITGTSALNANFTNQSLTTSMTFTGVNVVGGGPALASQTFNGSANFNQGNQNLAGHYLGLMGNAATPSVYGTFVGRFFGPHAEEYGYTFAVGNGTTSANSTVFGVGVAVGKR